ncbi:MAG: hypothetical protein R2830_23725 [Saprospiraceae bacterium]
MQKVSPLLAEGTLTAGYLRPKWGIAAEAGFERSLPSNLHHKLLWEHYPEIRDGWYSSTGGNYKFGLAANYTFPGLSIF